MQTKALRCRSIVKCLFARVNIRREARFKFKIVRKKDVGLMNVLRQDANLAKEGIRSYKRKRIILSLAAEIKSQKCR